MACVERLDSLLRLADGELAVGDRRDLHRHVAACEACHATLELLATENRAIAAALAPARVKPSLPLRGRLTAAAATLLLTAGVLYGLLLVYERIDASQDRNVGRADAMLGVPVLIRAEEVPLGGFLAELSETSGVSVALAPSALVRLKPQPTVSITLCNPITLRSILALVSEFHDLTPKVEGDGVILR